MRLWCIAKMSAKMSVRVAAWELLGQRESLWEAASTSALDDRVPLAVVVRPGLQCRRPGCEVISEFSSVHALRQHYREVHSAHDAAEKAEAGDESSSEDDDDDDDGSSVEDEASAVGAMIPVRVTDRGGTAFYIFRSIMETCGRPAVAELAGDRMRRGHLHVTAADMFQPAETWTVVMFQSGYFECAVWEVAPSGPGARAGPEGGWPRVLMHKRFARYTTRRKQGGSQSAHDAKRGSTAKSAGANLRRAGELHLQQDIAGLLADPTWAAAIRACRRVFMAAPRTATGQLFDGSTLVRGDPRISRVPFMTSRPSLAETRRIVETLCELIPVPEHAAAPAAGAGSATAVGAVAASVPKRVAVAFAQDEAAALAAAREIAAQTVHAASKASALSALADSAASQVGPSAAGISLDAAIDAINCGPDSSGESGDETKAAGDSRDTQQRAPQKARHRTRKNKKQSKFAIQPDDLAALGEEEEGGSENELLETAAAEAMRQGAIASERAAAVQRHRELQGGAQRALNDLADRLRVPPLAVARMLSLPSLAPSRAGAAPRSGGAGSGALLDRDALQGALDACSTAALLLDEGAKPAEACGALGWDGLAAAILVASSGYFVDWSQVEAPPEGQSRGRGAGDSEDDDLPTLGAGGGRGLARPAAAASASAGGKKGKKKGKAKAGTAAGAPAPAAVSSSAVVAPPAPVDPLASLSPAERKRALMAQAAERRANQQQAQPAAADAAQGGSSVGALARAAAGAVAAVAQAWVPGLH